MGRVDTDGDAALRTRSGRWWWIVLLVAAPFVVAMVASFVGSWYVTSAAAILATRVLDAPDDLPLVGVYSRFGWYHPGPALAWWFMVPSWVSGGAPSVLLAAGIALKGLAAVVATVLAGRRAGLVGAALIGALAMTLFVNHADTPYSIWNPTLVVLCFLCLLVAGWALAAGDRWAAPVLVVAGSVCIQAHVGYLPLVVVVSGFAAVLAAVGAWHTSPKGRGWRAALLVAGGLGVLLWAPVLIDQIFVSGNLGAIVDYFAGPEEPALGLAGALGRAARSSVPWGPWIGGIEPVGLLGDLLEAPIWWLLFPAAALGASGVAAWWKRDRELAALTAVVTVASVAGVVTLGLLSDVPYPYLYSWSRVVGGLIWCTLALAAVRTLVAGRPRWNGAVRAAVVAMTVSIAVVALVVVPTGPRPDARLSDAVEALLPAAKEATAPGEVVAMTFTEAFPGVGPGLVYELERAGRHVTVPPDSAFVWSGTRGADPDSADVELAVASGVALATFAADRDGRSWPGSTHSPPMSGRSTRSWLPPCADESRTRAIPTWHRWCSRRRRCSSGTRIWMIVTWLGSSSSRRGARCGRSIGPDEPWPGPSADSGRPGSLDCATIGSCLVSSLPPSCSILPLATVVPSSD